MEGDETSCLSSECIDGQLKSNSDWIIMTPLLLSKLTFCSSCLLFERSSSSSTLEHISASSHVGQGSNYRLIINKNPCKDLLTMNTNPHIILQFKVYLVDRLKYTDSDQDANLQPNTKESRTEMRQLDFWFTDNFNDKLKHGEYARMFFKSLLTPIQKFPRDYSGFISKIMKLMQKNFVNIEKLKLTLTNCTNQDTQDAPVFSLSKIEYSSTHSDMFLVLKIMENLYPSYCTVFDVYKRLDCDIDQVEKYFLSLQQRRLIQRVGNSVNTYMRTWPDASLTRTITRNQFTALLQKFPPTVAIVTAKYWDSVAVGFRIENKHSYIYYTSSDKYITFTLGKVAKQCVVSTVISAVSLFPSIRHLLSVGTAGCLDCVGDHSSCTHRHVRVGDVVVSSALSPASLHTQDAHDSSQSLSNGSYIYMLCDACALTTTEFTCNRRLDVMGNKECVMKTFTPGHPLLAQLTARLYDCLPTDFWLTQNDVAETLSKHQHTPENSSDFCAVADFSRPCTHRHRSVGVCQTSRDVPAGYGPVLWRGGGQQTEDEWTSEGLHVQAPTLYSRDTACRDVTHSQLHLGRVACIRGGGRVCDSLRDKLATQAGVLAYESDYNCMLETVITTSVDSYLFIRGISDNRDGREDNAWTKYSILMATAFMKELISNIDGTNDIINQISLAPSNQPE